VLKDAVEVSGPELRLSQRRLPMTTHNSHRGAVLPSGLRLAHEFVTCEEEKELIALIEAAGMPYIDYDPGNRRCEHTFGWEYDYPNERIFPGKPLPDSFLPIRERAAAFAGIKPQSIIQCLLLRYDPGSLIQPHCDKPVWQNVIGMSLGAATTMVFVKEASGIRETIAVELPPRSIYLQTGDARYVWQHSLPVVEKTRWGITFRDFSDQGLSESENVASRPTILS
jgi:alkylated DNA repair dioxygenase AlkB